MIGLDIGICLLYASRQSGNCLIKSGNITAKNTVKSIVASPYFTANDFAFAYARA